MENLNYNDRVAKLARDFPRFKPLQSFLSLQETRTSNIKSVDLFEDDGSVALRAETVLEDDLPKAIGDGSSRRLFIVENLSPGTATTIGDCLGVDPEFFIDYIDAIPSEFVISKEGKDEEAGHRRELMPRPWYRFEKVDGYLPMLSSVKPRSKHINIQHIGPIEYETSLSKNLAEPTLSTLPHINVARKAGLHYPIDHNLNGRNKLNKIAMARHTVAVWFKPPDDLSQPKWTTGTQGLTSQCLRTLPNEADLSFLPSSRDNSSRPAIRGQSSTRKPREYLRQEDSLSVSTVCPVARNPGPKD